MGESVQYLAANLHEIEAALSGEDSAVEAAIVVLSEDIADATARAGVKRMLEGETWNWDRGPMRECAWETFRDASGYFAGAFRLFGRLVGFDAWPDGGRLQWILADWHPMDRAVGFHVSCRPLRGLRFHGFPGSDRDAITTYLECYPHGYLLRDELPGVISGLHRLIGELVSRLSGGETDNPLAELAPGGGFPRESMLNVMTLDDGSLEGWQLGRAVLLYDAVCRAAGMDRDLVSVGY